MSYKETDWFSCMTVPTRTGVYKTQHRATTGPVISGYSWFDAVTCKWGMTQKSIHVATTQWGSTQQNKEWKGVLRDDVPS